ncbi:MAG: M48 family metalloprotease [Thermoanaerobaculia bacterium]
MKRRPLWLRRTALSLVPLLLVAGCSANPATGKQQLNFYNEQEEIALGQEADEEIVGEVGLYEDPAVQAYVSGLGKRMAASSERPGLPWSFKVLDDPAINAFALPGGYVYVTRGILTHLGSEAELATVIGHEMGHVTARHGVNQISKQMMAMAGLGIAALFADSDTAEAVAGAAAVGLSLLFLSNSRNDESQADQLGLRYAQRSGYDLRESPELFRLLDRAEKVEGAGRLPHWLSTHPDPGSRRHRLEEKIAEMQKAGTSFDGTLVNRDPYLAKLDGMVFGENPREGFFRERTFLHPEMQLQFEFPDGWETSNEKASVSAMSPGEDAFLQISLSGKASMEEAADEFFQEDGVTEGKSWERRVHGLPASWHRLEATTDDGELRGTVAFVSHLGKVFQILAVAEKDKWQGYQADLEGTMASFAKLTDPKALSVQPRHMNLIRLKKGMTIEELASAYPSTVPLETVALINHVEAGGRLEAGRLFKQVVGGSKI